MTTVINQPFGLGDIIFCMTLAEQFRADSDRIVWPVLPQFVDGLKRAYPTIEWQDASVHPSPIDEKREVIQDDVRYVPLRWSMEITGTPYSQVMRSKYDMYGLDFRMWKEHGRWLKDGLPELELIKLLNLPKEFALVNRYFQSDFGGKAQIPVLDMPTVEMRTIPGFSLFDWMAVAERATEIHTVSTSLLYLLELKPPGCPVHLYPRLPQETDFRNVDYLFTNAYILH